MNKIFLFDVDGTLTPARQKINPEMLNFIKEIKSNVILAIVSGSDFLKIKEQIGDDVLELFTYVFSENGLVFHKDGKMIHKKSLRSYFSQQQLNRFINRVLRLIADIDLPVKTGTFVEYRNGMINISPIGRNCTQDERDEFEKLDLIYGFRQRLIDQLKDEFSDMNLNYSIGGQISFDVYPYGTNKTFCLQYLVDLDLNLDAKIYFFGDKTEFGQNDYEIYHDTRVVGCHVDNYHDTIQICKSLVQNFSSK